MVARDVGVSSTKTARFKSSSVMRYHVLHFEWAQFLWIPDVTLCLERTAQGVSQPLYLSKPQPTVSVLICTLWSTKREMKTPKTPNFRSYGSRLLWRLALHKKRSLKRRPIQHATLKTSSRTALVWQWACCSSIHCTASSLFGIWSFGCAYPSSTPRSTSTPTSITGKPLHVRLKPCCDA